MSHLLKALRKIAVVVLVLLALSVALVAVLRFLSDTDEARAAIALMEAPPRPADGDNAIAWIAFLDLRIPEADIPAAFAEDVAAHAAWHASGGAWGEPGRFESPAATRYPVRPPVAEPDKACTWGDTGCLAKVAANADAVRAWLSADAERLALAERSLKAGHARHPYAPGFDSPFLAYQAWRMPLNAVAMQAVDGDVPGAMARACALVADARRLAAGADSLIAKQVAFSLTDRAAALALDIARLQPGQPLPADCTTGFAPVDTADYELCDAFRGEYRAHIALGEYMQYRLRRSWSPAKLAQGWLLLDRDMQRRWSARTLGVACTDDFRRGLTQGEVPPAMPVSGLHDPYCYAAFVTCVLYQVSVHRYFDYQERMLDYAAKHRLLIALARQAADGSDDATMLAAASSPGYSLEREGDAWVLDLKLPRAGERHFRIAASPTPSPAPSH